MNKLILVVPVLAVAALAGCKSSGNVSGAVASHSAQATAAASEGATAAQDALSTCLPKGTKITESYLISLATTTSARDKLATECKIPKVTATYPATKHDKQANRTAFGLAVAASALNEKYHGDFKTAAGRDTWANQVFPVILSTYRTK